MQQGGRALDALGVSEAVRAAATPTDRHVSIDANTGAELGVHGERSAAARRGRGARAKAAATHLPRGTLRDVLLDRLRPDTVRWGAKLESASPSEDGWSLTVDGVTESCSILGRRGRRAVDGAAAALRRRRGGDAPGRLRGAGLLCSSVRVCGGLLRGRRRHRADLHDAVRRRKTMWQLSWRGDGPDGRRRRSSPRGRARTSLGLAGLPRRGAAHRSDGAGRRHGLSDRR